MTELKLSADQLISVWENAPFPDLLASSPLAQTPLCRASLPPECPPSQDGYAVQALLHWTLLRFHPKGRHYLERCYLQNDGENIKEIAEKEWHALSQAGAETEDFEKFYGKIKQRFQRIRGKAKTIWLHELTELCGMKERRRITSELRWQGMSKREQALLCFLSLFFQPESPLQLHQLVPLMAHASSLAINQALLETLQRKGWVTEIEKKWQLNPFDHPFVEKKAQQDIGVWRKRHNSLAQRYAEQKLYLPAVQHGLCNEEWERCAQWICDHKQAICTGQEGLAIWWELLSHLPLLQIREKERAFQLRLIMGNVAKKYRTMVEAEERYLHATESGSADFLAELYYELGHLCQQKRHKDALDYYQQAIDQPTHTTTTWQYTAKIGIAWIYSRQHRWSEAEQLLTKVEKEIDSPELLSDLHNCWNEYYTKRGDNPAQRLFHAQKAQEYAYQSADPERQIITANNLALICAQQNQIERGKGWAQKSLELAQEKNHIQFIYRAYKTLGSVSYYAKEMESYYSHNLNAYQFCKKSGFIYDLAYICHDLAEAALLLGRLAEARGYYSEALALATQDPELHQRIEGLSQQSYPELSAALNERQITVFPYIRQHQTITAQEYMRYGDCSRSTAQNELSDLVKNGLLKKVGEGPATYYRLP